jgi:GT2 family glycosyltransferase
LITSKSNKFTYSAIVTTYNPNYLLKQAINSIVNQNIRPKELILINDASKNFNFEDISKIVPKDIEMIFISNPTNSGAAHSRNIGVSVSTTKNIIFFDDDDISLPHRASLHLNAFISGATVSYVSSSKIYENKYQVFFKNSEVSPLLISPSIFVKKMLIGGRTNQTIGDVPCATLGIKKQALLDVGGFDDSLRRLEDVDLAIRLSINGEYFSWSSDFAVIRQATFGKNKGGLIEVNHEQILIKKYGNMLSIFNLYYAQKLSDLRRIYFGEIKSLKTTQFLRTMLHPFNLFIIIVKFKKLAQRIVHDFRKKAM